MSDNFQATGYVPRANDLNAGVMSSATQLASGDGVFDDWFASDNQYNHNEAIYEWERNENSAKTARDWSEYMSNTAIQRAVKDYEAAGFSPLAALQGGGASVPAGVAGSGSAAKAGKSSGAGPSTILKALSAIGMIVGASVGSAAKMASAAAAAKTVDSAARRSAAKLYQYRGPKNGRW